MNNPKNDSYYIQKILTDINFIMKQMKDISVDELRINEILLDSMLFRLIQIQENSRKLSDNFKMKHTEIPWKDISGLRNRIVHDYGSVDLSVVFDTLTKDIPWLKNRFEDTMKN